MLKLPSVPTGAVDSVAIRSSVPVRSLWYHSDMINRKHDLPEVDHAVLANQQGEGKSKPPPFPRIVLANEQPPRTIASRARTIGSRVAFPFAVALALMVGAAFGWLVL